MNYDKKTWHRALCRALSYSGKRSPGHGELAVWAEQLVADKSVSALPNEHVAKKMAELRDSGMPVYSENDDVRRVNHDAPPKRVAFPASYGHFRRWLLESKPLETVSLQPTLTFEPWQQAIIDGCGTHLATPGLAASRLLFDGTEYILTCPCRATAANLSMASLLRHALCRANWTAKEHPAAVPDLATKNLRLQYNGQYRRGMENVERTWIHRPPEATTGRTVHDPIKAATDALRKREAPTPDVAAAKQACRNAFVSDIPDEPITAAVAE